MIASHHNWFTDVVELLLEYGVDPNIEDIDGSTTLSIAVDENQVKIVELLLKAGAILYEKMANFNGFTELMMAVRNDNGETIKLLLKYGADPNIQNQNGATAIQSTNSYPIKVLLRRYGAI